MSEEKPKIGIYRLLRFLCGFPILVYVLLCYPVTMIIHFAASKDYGMWKNKVNNDVKSIIKTFL